MNRIILIGRLGRNPELRTLPTGAKFAVMSIVTEETWKDKDTQQWQSRPEWHRIIARGHNADYALANLNTGDSIYVEGTKRTRKYTPDDGVEREIVEVHPDVVRLHHRHTPKQSDGEQPSARPTAQPQGWQEGRSAQQPESFSGDPDDDDHPGRFTRF